MKEKIKVGGKPGALGESVSVVREPTLISVTAKIAFSKRYLKVYFDFPFASSCSLAWLLTRRVCPYAVLDQEVLEAAAAA